MLAGLLIAAAPTAYAAAQPPVPDAPHDQMQHDMAQINDAMTRMRTGDTEAGLRLIEPILTRLEADAARHVARGERIYSAQTTTQTIAYMLIAVGDKVPAVDLGPALGLANFTKAYALVDLHRADEAKSFMDRAVALSPQSSQYLCELGRWHGERKQTAIALDLYQRCLDGAATGPENTKIHYEAAALRGKGYVLIDMDRLDEAEAALRKSLTLEPGNPLALNELGYIADMRTHRGQGKT